jgi:hypothetical protein
MFNGVCEEWIVLTPFDLVRPIDAPSRGCQCCSTVWLWCEIGVWVGALSAAALNYRGSARVSA